MLTQNEKLRHMKFLKIENNKGFYRLDTDQDVWTEIDQINKENLLELIKFASAGEFEMDDFKDELLQNPAHNIIYNNIYVKFNDFLKNKTRFQDSAESTYTHAIEKYKLI